MRLTASTILFLTLSGLLSIASGCGGSQSSKGTPDVTTLAPPSQNADASHDTIAGADEKKEEKEEEKKKETVENSSMPCHSLDEKPENWEDPLHSSTFIDSSALQENRLLLWVHYSGCEEGTLLLRSRTPAAGKRSMPQHISLKMAQAGMCEMLLRKKLCLDLSSLAYRGPEYSLIINEGQDTIYYHQ